MVCWIVLIFISFVAFVSFYYIFFILYVWACISTSYVWGCGVLVSHGSRVKVKGYLGRSVLSFCHVDPWVRPWVIRLTEGRAIPLALVCFGARVRLAWNLLLNYFCVPVAGCTIHWSLL